MGRPAGERAHHRLTPVPAAVARRVARRYVAGEDRTDAVARARRIVGAGHAVSVECVGESVRDRAVAMAETEEFLALVEHLRDARLPAWVCLDLTHVGGLVDPALGRANVGRIVEVAAAADLPVVLRRGLGPHGPRPGHL